MLCRLQTLLSHGAEMSGFHYCDSDGMVRTVMWEGGGGKEEISQALNVTPRHVSSHSHLNLAKAPSDFHNNY